MGFAACPPCENVRHSHTELKQTFPGVAHVWCHPASPVSSWSLCIRLLHEVFNLGPRKSVFAPGGTPHLA